MNARSTERHRADGQLVSIVIPVYNGSRYVAQAIDSALAQTWPWIEVIVVDDGSDDGGATRHVVERYGDRIRFISKPNGGVGSALNTGIAAMRGACFSWLSHDDLYLPTKIERYMKALDDAPGTTIVFGEVELVDAQARPIQRAGLLDGWEAEADARWLVLEGRLNGCAMLIPRECLTGAAPFDVALPTTQDYALWFDLASRYPFVAVHEALVRSRVHEEQGSRHQRHLEEASLLWLQMIERMECDTPLSGPVLELQRLRRVQRFLRRAPYRGAHAYVDRRVQRHMHRAEVALVCLTDSAEQAARALDLVSATGATCSELLVVDGKDDAATAHAWDSLRLPLRFHQIRMPRRFAEPGKVLATALERTHAPILILLDAAAHMDAAAISEGVRVVAADEGDAWMTAPDEGSPLGALHGAVIRRAAVSDVLSAGPQAYPLMALRARIVPAYTPRSPAAPASTGPAVAAPHGRSTLPGPPSLDRMPQPDRPTLLILVHAMGGGTIRYAELVAAGIGIRVNVLFGWGVGQNVFFLSSQGPEFAEVSYELPLQMTVLIDDLRALGVARVDAMHSIGLDDHFDVLLSRLGVPYDLTLVDYHQVAVQPHLVDEAGVFVGDDALRRLDHPLLRPHAGSRLRAAERVIACSRDLAARVGRLSGVQGVIPVRIPEAGNPDRFALHRASLGVDEWMRVLFLGAIAPHKGAQVLADVASQLRRLGIPIRIECLGAIHVRPPDDALANPHLRLWGRYETGALHTLLCEIRPHLAWFPFTAPETHSFALSEALLQGLPVLATGVGAVPERLHGRPGSWMLTPEEATPERITMWLDRLRRERLDTAPRWLPVAHLPPSYERFYPEEYLRPLQIARP